ncbi:MAG TPA: CHASE2 domain-containing protein [Vicinamibacteria bacterium]|nr:CHASE2 domain-containing protein [Vicinamibacteria bacterium]
MPRGRASAGTSPWARRLIVAGGVSVSLAASLLALLRPAALTRVDSLAFDSMARRDPALAGCALPVIVEFDDEALARHGHWPWPRALFAQLLDRLQALRPRAVGIDVVFPEPEESPAGGRPKLSDGERALARSLAQGPFVLGWAFVFGPGVPQSSRTPPPVFVGITSLRAPGAPEPGQGLWSASGAVCSLPELTRAAHASGFLNAGMDPDGILRRIALLIEHEGTLYPSLGLATALETLGVRQAVLESSLSGDRVLRAGDRRIPLDSRGRLLLRYRCEEGGPARISAAAILEGRVPPAAVEGRVVFVGASATGFGESIATPIDPAVPGVVAHAITASNILERDFARQGSAPLVAAIVLGIGLLATLACRWLRPLSGALVLGAAVFGTWHGSARLFHATGVVISPVLPALVLAAHFVILALVHAFYGERRAEVQTRDLAATRDFVTESLASLTAIRDTETGGHILRTQHYVRILCEAAAGHPRFRRALTPAAIELIAKLAPIHDIGKVGVPDDLLHKPTMLTPEEFEVVKKHALHGRDAIAHAEARAGVGETEYLRIAKELAYSHHECWDGSGYPQGLSGEAIPLAGRLMAIADVYDALVSVRVYKQAFPHEEAVRLIREGRGRQFDPDLVDAFLSVEHEWWEIHLRLVDQ